MKLHLSVLTYLAALCLSAGFALAGPAAPSSTPEPATLALVGGAAGCLILVDRIRKRFKK
jgi:hypothetical protein